MASKGSKDDEGNRLQNGNFKMADNGSSIMAPKDLQDLTVSEAKLPPTFDKQWENTRQTLLTEPRFKTSIRQFLFRLYNKLIFERTNTKIFDKHFKLILKIDTSKPVLV